MKSTFFRTALRMSCLAAGVWAAGAWWPMGPRWTGAAQGDVADAAEAGDGKPLPGHSNHGEAFDEGPRRAAKLMGGTGEVHLPITTADPQAQAFFDQGLGQLHGFWYLEAERSFRQASSLDPDCAMSYWGMAMANFGNARRAWAFIAEAARRKGQAGISAKEVRWIEALDAFYQNEPRDERARKKNFVSAWKQLAGDDPKDVEAKAFFARFAWEYKRDAGVSNEAIDGVLNEIFKIAPKHPAHHYRIHLWDSDKAERALSSAALNGPSAPAIAHMWHMPGHTYDELRRYADTAWQQEASARVDHAYMIHDRVMPFQIFNYAHNNEWLCRNLLYVGRVHDSIDLAKNMIELPRHPKYNMSSNRGSGAELGRARLIDALAQHEMWAEYLALCDAGYLTDEGEFDQRVRKLRWQGVACAALGRDQAAAGCIAAMEKLKSPSPATRPAAASSTAARSTVAEAPSSRPAAPAAKAAPPMPRRGRGRDGDNRAPIDQALAHIRATQSAKAGDLRAAAEGFAKANASKAVQARAWLEANDRQKAINLARQAVDEGKGTVFPLAVYAGILWECGRKEEAKQTFERLRELSERIDLDVHPYVDMKEMAAALGYDNDWRQPRKTPPDLGVRPALDTLGPFRWHPWKAAPFSAIAADGSRVSSDAYRGKPVVVIFYLGHGCLHCTQQLHAFAPLARQFADAGISLVGISTDPTAELHLAWASYKSDAAEMAGDAADRADSFPFPLLSDPRLDLFHQFACYDDFEHMPLHGTFLIDGQRNVRWQDISYEPFLDARFLLTEAKRLLAQPTNRAGS